MADAMGNKISKDYRLDVPFVNSSGFYVKGASGYEWGMKDRLARIFSPKSGNTVMLAFDHGYMMGATAGLERLDIVIPMLAPHVDCLMGTRGAIRSCVPPTFGKAVALRCSSGSSVLEDDMSHETMVVDMEDAIRINASALAIQTFIGADGQKETIEALNKCVNLGMRYGIPTLGVVAVGKQMERTPRFFKLATRMLAEFGAQIIKTYYCDEFEEIVAACPVPIVIAGGKKSPEDEALTLAYNAISHGAQGVDMGRNIFQARNPLAMAKCVAKIVHEKFTDKQAYEMYLDLVRMEG